MMRWLTSKCVKIIQKIDSDFFEKRYPNASEGLLLGNSKCIPHFRVLIGIGIES